MPSRIPKHSFSFLHYGQYYFNIKLIKIQYVGSLFVLLDNIWVPQSVLDGWFCFYWSDNFFDHNYYTLNESLLSHYFLNC